MIVVSTIEKLGEGSVRVILFDHEENRIGIVDAYAVRWYNTPRRKRGAAKKSEEDEPVQTALEDEIPEAAEITDSDDDVLLTDEMFVERR